MLRGNPVPMSFSVPADGLALNILCTLEQILHVNTGPILWNCLKYQMYQIQGVSKKRYFSDFRRIFLS